MLEFEAALAVAEARAGVVPPEAATAIVERCRSLDVDLAALGHAARLGATPVIPLVAQLRQLLPPDVARWAHFGATSQDVLDTALMLVLQRVLDLVSDAVARLSAAAAALAEEHRSTLIAARTLLQHAAPTTFGRKAAGWLVATVEVGEVLREVRRHRLAVQLGGPAGTLAALGRPARRLWRRWPRNWASASRCSRGTPTAREWPKYPPPWRWRQGQRPDCP